MASTITLSGDWLISAGSRRQTFGTGNLGTYASGGVAVSPTQVGLGVIDSLTIDPAGGYTFFYDASSGKVLAYISAGTVAAPTITTTTNAGTTEPMYTNGGALTQTTGATGITGVQAPAYTGAAGTEVGAVDLSGTTFTFRAIGR